jgi:hypothetical protein
MGADLPVSPVKEAVMPYVAVGEENPGSIELYYEDHGSGRPVVRPVVIEDGPHAIPWAHAGQVNAALLSFIGAHADATVPRG